MQIKWLSSALNNIEHIASYIAADNPTAARQVITRIKEATDHLAEQPEMGRIGRVVETRELIITGTPYLVIYRIKNRSVEILRVLHTKQKWPPDV